MRAVENRAYGSQQAPKCTAATSATVLGASWALLAGRTALSVFRTYSALHLNDPALLRAIACHILVGGTVMAALDVAATVPGLVVTCFLACGSESSTVTTIRLAK